MDKWNLEEAISYYKKDSAPKDQDALVALLREVQNENNGILPDITVKEIALKMEIKESFLTALIKRYPSLRTETAPNLLEICGGPRCAKNASEKLLRFIAAEYNVQSGGISQKGKFAYKVVGCMKHCVQGPNVKWNGKVYNKMDVKKLVEIIEKKQR